MIRDGYDLGEIEEFLRMAKALARAQETEIRRMRQMELDVKQAEGLLSAYREALRIAGEHHQRLKEQLEIGAPQQAAIHVLFETVGRGP